MKKAFLPILLALTIMMSFSSCDGGGDVSSTAENTQINTIEPPEDGWTPELLNSVLYLNGEPFPLPYPVSELEKNKDYEIKELNYYGDGMADGSLYYKGNYLGSLGITNCTEESKIQIDSEIVEFLMSNHFGEFSNTKGSVSINGIYLGSTRDEVIKKLGEKYKSGADNGVYSYIKDNKTAFSLFFTFNNDKNTDCVSTIIIISSKK